MTKNNWNMGKRIFREKILLVFISLFSFFSVNGQDTLNIKNFDFNSCIKVIKIDSLNSTYIKDISLNENTIVYDSLQLSNLNLTTNIFIDSFNYFIDSLSTKRINKVNEIGEASGFIPPVSIMPSPTAASLIKQTTENVDLYTGKLTVSYPLFEFSSRSINLPISLTYSTNGMKVNDLATWVGMGWNLNVGGVISRVMNGMPDEYVGSNSISEGNNSYSYPVYGYLKFMEKNNNSPTFLSPENIKNLANLEEFLLNSKMSGNIYNLKAITEGWDTEPDEFYFNFDGYSGKIVFDATGKPITIPHYNFKIEYFKKQVDGVESIYKFIITTDNGTKYIFGDDDLSSVEFTRSSNFSINIKYNYLRDFSKYIILSNLICFSLGKGVYSNIPSLNIQTNNTPYYASSWYLKKIESQDNDYIIFNYTKINQAYIQDRNTSFSTPNFPKLNNSYYYPYEYPSQSLSISENIIENKAVYLSKITNAIGDKIIFSLDNREDLFGGKKLINIEKQNYEGYTIKKFIFNYDNKKTTTEHDWCYIAYQYNYTCLTINIDGFYPDLVNCDKNRLFLISLTETTGTDTLPKTEFIYNSVYDMPKRFSLRQDNSGYFNNSNDGVYSIMSSIDYQNIVSGEYIDPICPWFIIDYNLNLPLPASTASSHNSNAKYAKIGVLKEIKYPTSGTKLFEYEFNHGLRISKITEDNIFQDNIVTTYTYGTPYICNSNSNSRLSYHLPISNDGYFDIYHFNSNLLNVNMTNGSFFGYKEVTVKKTGLGKTVYKFLSPSDIPDEIVLPIYKNQQGNWTSYTQNSFPFSKHFNTDWKRGLISDIFIYKEENLTQPIKQIHNEYNFSLLSDQPKIWALKSGLTYFNIYSNGHLFASFPLFIIGFNYYYSPKNVLIKTTEINFDERYFGQENKAVKTITEYNYQNNLRINGVNKGFIYLKDIKRTLDNHLFTKTEFIYPFDNNCQAVLPTQTMLDKFILGIPVQIKQYKNNTLIANNVDDYTTLNNSVLLEKKRIFNFEKQLFEEDLCIKSRDNNNNITEYKRHNDVDVSVVWGYKKSKPIAVIENSSYNLFVEKLQELGYTIDDLQNKKYDVLINIFNNLRPKLPNSFISSYTYKDNQNINSVTDINGKTEFYNYDRFGRLIYIKNQENFLIKYLEYNYGENYCDFDLKYPNITGKGCDVNIEVTGCSSGDNEIFEWYIGQDCSGEIIHIGKKYSFVANGEDNEVLYFTVKNKITNKSKTCSITIKYATIVYSDMLIDYTPSSFSYILLCEGQFEIIQNSSWAYFTVDGQKVTFTITENTSHDIRIATLKYKINGILISFKVTQYPEFYAVLDKIEIVDEYGLFIKKRIIRLTVKYYNTFNNLNIYSGPPTILEGNNNFDKYHSYCIPIPPPTLPPSGYKIYMVDVKKGINYNIKYDIVVLGKKYYFEYNYLW